MACFCLLFTMHEQLSIHRKQLGLIAQPLIADAAVWFSCSFLFRPTLLLNVPIGKNSRIKFVFLHMPSAQIPEILTEKHCMAFTFKNLNICPLNLLRMRSIAPPSTEVIVYVLFHQFDALPVSSSPTLSQKNHFYCRHRSGWVVVQLVATAIVRTSLTPSLGSAVVSPIPRSGFTIWEGRRSGSTVKPQKE